MESDRRARIDGYVYIDEGGIIADALDRIANLEKRVTHLEGSETPAWSLDDLTPLGVGTRRVLEFLDNNAPTLFTAAVIGSNLDIHPNKVASSTQVLVRRGEINVIRKPGERVLYQSKRHAKCQEGDPT